MNLGEILHGEINGWNILVKLICKALGWMVDGGVHKYGDQQPARPDAEMH